MNKEPALAIGGGAAFVGAVLTLIVSFGGSLTQEQTAAILGVAVVVLPLLQAAVTRAKVYAPYAVELLKRRLGVDDVPEHRA